MDFDHWDKRLAAWLKSHEPLREDPKGFSAHSALLAAKYVTAIASYLPGEVGLMAKELFEAIHHAENGMNHPEAGLSEHKAEQAVDEQARVDQQAKDVQAKVDEQAKAKNIKADAELAAQVIEEQTIIVEKEISDREEKSAGEIDALKKDFEREEQDLEGKLDEMARNYFDKYPDLSDDQRRDATDTFNGVKDEAMGNLHGQQETRLEELTRAQQEQREDLENLKALEDLKERLKELEGTRDERS
jgi:hypothetical protein